MPIYEYLCAKCSHEFERKQRITDDPVKTCPECRSRRVKRLISQTSFVLKGSGWYADGYGNKADSKKSDDTGSDTSKSDSGSDTPSAEPSGESKKDSSPKKDSGDTKKDAGDAKKSKKSTKAGKAAA